MRRSKHSKITLIIIFLVASVTSFAQNVSINGNGSIADPSAMLDVKATDKGILIPRMTAVQRLAIVTPATGLMVYQTNNVTGFWYYDGAVWVIMVGGNSGEFLSSGGIVKNTTALTDDFVFGSNSLTNQAGTADDARFFFDKSKGAFRAGGVSWTQWDDANRGLYSIALGYGTTASGESSISIGLNTIASGESSVAIGRSTSASGYASTALGHSTIASGFVSTTLGRQTTATGHYSTALGYLSTASVYASTALGLNTSASGDHSTAIGYSTIASGNVSIALGRSTSSPSYGETAVGIYSLDYTPASATAYNVTDRLFSIGNGTSTAARSNALTVLKNGNVGLGTNNTNPSATLAIKGSFQLEDGNEAVGKVLTSDAAGNATWQVPVAGGEFLSSGGIVKNTTDLTNDDFVFGSNSLTNQAGTADDHRLFFDKSKGAFRAGGASGTEWDNANRGLYSTAMGSNAIASGDYSTAMGHTTIASGHSSTALGYKTIASGAISTVLGVFTTARSYGETTVGIYSLDYTPVSSISINGNDRLFSVGNGTATSRTNALTVLKNGKIGIGANNTTPSATLDVKGSFQLEDGNEAVGKVLTSDAAGNATWQVSVASGEFLSSGGVVKNTTALTDDFVFGSNSLTNQAGTADDNRFFFDESKGAFRAGGGIGTEWDDANRGYYSVALGFGNTASGDFSTAIGRSTRASGYSSTAIGRSSIASGPYSTAIGYETTASVNYSTAIGFRTVASGDYSTALGAETTASGTTSAALGYFSTASGDISTALGFNTTARSYGETTVGVNSLDYTPASATAFNGNDRIFSIGNGSSTTKSNALTVLKNGNVGIGTVTPTQATLVVNGSRSNTLSYGYLHSSGSTGSSSGNYNYSIYASHRIAASEFNAFSDKRIKNRIGISNSKKDLEIISKIEIMDYNMIDTISKGNKNYKKVIAQQVKKIYPQAVSNNLTRTIPNIYQISAINDGWINLTTDLVVGDKVKLILSDKEELVVVTEISTAGFKVKSEQPLINGKVFVYGKEVHDFHTVDYEAISMLNVSATQELLKIIKQLAKEKQGLTKDFNAFKTATASKFSKIEKMLLQSQGIVNK
ncbi:MAG: tail fiber domain-containing protein [Flavobacteriales bacterium]|nr:tail fiber domain-containing protein [Flavobacteriales bacterium]